MDSRSGKNTDVRSIENNPKSKIQNPKFAIAIDLGSNTLRVVKRDCERGEFVAKYEKIVRTADGLQESGRIGEGAVARIVRALNEAREKIGFDGAVLRAVTTEAMRRASNRREVLRQIEAKTGIRFEIIEGDEEAALTLLAVERRLTSLSESGDSFVMVDIGGGSTELIFRYPDGTISRSFPLGIVTLSQEAGSLEKVGKLLPQKLPPLRDFVEAVYHEHGRVRSFVATAGTPTTVAALKLGMNYRSYDAKRINGTRLQRSELEIYLNRLLTMDKAEREEAVGVGRDDLIAAGILIFEALFDLLGFDKCIVIDDGLREGVAISLCSEE